MRPEPILGAILGIVVISGVLWSPVSRTQRVRVDGAPDYDRARIEKALSKLQDLPFFAVNEAVVEAQILENSAVRSADLRRNFVGSALLEVTYRIPVARLEGSQNIAVSRDGVPFRSPELPEDIPRLHLLGRRRDPKLALASDAPLATLVDVLDQVQAIGDFGPLRLEFGENGGLCLNMGAGIVELGSVHDLPKKLEVLRDVLKREPGILARIDRLRLIEPSNPVYLLKPSI